MSNEEDKELFLDTKILMDRFVGDLLFKFRSELNRAQNMSEYFALVSSVVVFKELVLAQFKYEVELDTTKNNESAHDICIAIEANAIKLAKDIDRRVTQQISN